MEIMIVYLFMNMNLIQFLEQHLKRVYWFCIFLKVIYPFIYVSLCWVFVATRVFLQLQPAGATVQLLCVGLSLQWLFLLQSIGSKVHRLEQLWQVGSVSVAPGLQSTGSVVAAHGLSCSTAHRIFLDQGSILLVSPAFTVDSLPLSHQRSLVYYIKCCRHFI